MRNGAGDGDEDTCVRCGLADRPPNRYVRAPRPEGMAKTAIETFETKSGIIFPKAVHYLIKDTDALLVFYDFPAEHWSHLRTSNPIPVDLLHGPSLGYQGRRYPLQGVRA